MKDDLKHTYAFIVLWGVLFVVFVSLTNFIGLT